MVPHERRSMPTPEELHIWREFIETSEVLRARLTARLQSESSLSSGDYQVLLALSEAEGRRLRSSVLAEQIAWERSRLSHHLGRMEKRGLVERSRCSNDAHGVDVILTPEGLDAFRSGSVPHLRAIRELFVDALTPTELTQLEQVTRSIRRHLDLPRED